MLKIIQAINAFIHSKQLKSIEQGNNHVLAVVQVFKRLFINRSRKIMSVADEDIPNQVSKHAICMHENILCNTKL